MELEYPVVGKLEHGKPKSFHQTLHQASAPERTFAGPFASPDMSDQRRCQEPCRSLQTPNMVLSRMLGSEMIGWMGENDDQAWDFGVLFFRHFPDKLGWKSDKTDCSVWPISTRRNVQSRFQIQEGVGNAQKQFLLRCRWVFSSCCNFFYSNVIIPLVKFHCLLVIKHGLLENPLFLGGIPTKTSMDEEFLYGYTTQMATLIGITMIVQWI